MQTRPSVKGKEAKKPARLARLASAAKNRRDDSKFKNRKKKKGWETRGKTANRTGSRFPAAKRDRAQSQGPKYGKKNKNKKKNG